MTKTIDTLEAQQVRPIPAFRVGDRVRVHFQVVEGTRRRTQVFEGTVLKQKGGGSRRTFTVRKLSFGVGVERTFPVHSPKIERIEVVGRGEVRRAKLYYLRGRVGRAARLREMRDFRPEEVAMIGVPTQPAAADGAAEPAPEGGAPADTAAEEAPAEEAPAEEVAEAAEAEAPPDEPSAKEPAGDEAPAAETEPQPEEPEASEPGDESPRGEQQPA